MLNVRDFEKRPNGGLIFLSDERLEEWNFIVMRCTTLERLPTKIIVQKLEPKSNRSSMYAVLE